MKEVKLIFLLPGMFSTGLVITVDIKADGVIKINNRPLKMFGYSSSMKIWILKCNNQDGGVYMLSNC